MTTLRHQEPPEPIEFYAHEGKCPHCSSVVKMMRDTATLSLRLDSCWCLGCAQRYYIELKEGQTTDEFESDQWHQKALKCTFESS